MRAIVGVHAEPYPAEPAELPELGAVTALESTVPRRKPERTVVLFVFCGAVGEVIQRAFVTELFATSHRGSAAGALVLAQTLGWSLGLTLFSLAADNDAALPAVISSFSLLMGIGGVCFLLLPETKRRELEETSGEVASASGDATWQVFT